MAIIGLIYTLIALAKEKLKINGFDKVDFLVSSTKNLSKCQSTKTT